MADRRAPRRGLPAHRLHAARAWARTSIPISASARTSSSSAGCSGNPAPNGSARIAELLDSTGLAPFADRPAKKLSGGMRQKLGLCCSLIHDPDLLILDEPTTGVDPLSRRQFWELIDRMRARRPGMSVVVATAYMEEAERFDWLVAMNAGKVAGGRVAGRAQGADRRRDTIEDAFIALLPDEQRAGHRATADTAAPHRRRRAGHHRARPDLPLRRFHRGRPGELHHRARRDLRLRRLERLRQDDDDEDADRPAAGERRRGAAVRPARSTRAT